MNGGGRLDPRGWLLWALAASLPPLLGRNPFVLLATLVAVIGVRAAWSNVSPAIASWRGIIRLGVLFAAIGVLFNVLTVHAGDRVIVQVPASLPILGGPLTLNALVYGVLSGIAVLTLLLVGTTLGAVLDWAALLRLLPARLATVAVAGSIAWAFIPGTVVALAEIREAQAARGHRSRGVRDLIPLVVPLLSGGLERGLTLAEALESRAFGAPPGPTLDAPERWRGVATVFGITGGTVGAYLLAVGRPVLAIATLMVALALFGLVVWEPTAARPRARRTRYREPEMGRAEVVIALASGLVLTIEIVTLAVDPGAFAYEPYPSLTAPYVSLPMLAGLGLLLAPAAVTP